MQYYNSSLSDAFLNPLKATGDIKNLYLQVYMLLRDTVAAPALGKCFWTRFFANSSS